MIRSSALSSRLLTGASVMALVITASPAAAQRFGRRTSIDPAAQAVRAAEGRATQNVAAQAAAARTRAAFAHASLARQQMDAFQVAARAAALAATVNVPNGLGPGGLQTANGVKTDPSLWIGANGPTQATGTDGRTKVDITQTQSKAILTWDSFNVGRETDLTFNQGDASWEVLNRVTSASADPSKILGTIKAVGSVYIINQNGILFGGASQINVRSLTASSLDIDGGAIERNRPTDSAGNPVSDSLWEQSRIAARNARFTDGLIQGGQPTITFSDYGSDDGYSLPPEVPTTDKVVVEAGAQIAVAPLGQAVLLGHDVSNAGTITAPDGQVLLSAGGDIYLSRGVDRAKNSSGFGPTGQIRGYIASSNRYGVVRNDGLAVATRGNVTMQGKSIDQNGLIAVTTAIDQAGSIILNASVKPSTIAVSVGDASNYGDIRIGAGSHMSILPDASGKTAVGNVFQPSTVEIIGKNITFGDDATLYAPSAQAFIYGPQSNSLDGGRFYLGEGATIDLSGLGGVDVAMSQNQIRAELRANELRDNPVLRDGMLRGESVYFDARLGEKLIDGTGVADLSGWYDLIPRDVAQFMTTGGSLTLQQDEIITRTGSLIDLSGGSVHYGDGMIQRTRLIDAYGHLVPIEFADAKTNYVGIEGDFIVSHARWGVTERFSNAFARIGQSRFQSGYDEGHSAGTLNVRTLTGQSGTVDDARIFDGAVHADTVTGQYQVGAPAGSTVTDVTTVWQERPALGTLNFSDIYAGGGFPQGGNITIADTGPRLGKDFTADTALFDYANGTAPLIDGIVANDHVLPADWFDGNTFGQVTLRSGDANLGTYSNAGGPFMPVPDHAVIGGVLTIGKGVTVDLGDYGTFDFAGRQAEIDGTILAPGGSVRLQAVHGPSSDGSTRVPIDQVAAVDVPGVHLGATGTIDVAGRWTNNLLETLNGLTLTKPVVDGGSVTIVAHDILLDAGSRIDVSGGAQLGVTGGSPVLGNGGAILLDNSEGSQTYNTADPTGRMALNGSLVGYAPGRGGSLTIESNDTVFIGGKPILPDGVLPSGEAAPIQLTLGSATTIPAGSTAPFPIAYTSNIVPAGGVFSSDASYYYYAPGGGDIPALGADWPLPEGFDAEDLAGNYYYGTGTIVPAGSVLDYLSGTFFAGSSLPADVFTKGLTFPSALDLVQPAGIAGADFTLPKGFVVPVGAVFDVDVPIVAPKTYAANFFNQGGFASYQLAGAQGVTVTAGTTIAPSVQTLTLNNVAGLATGARLADIATVAGSGVTLVDSATLPAALRPATDLVLSTVATTIDGSSGGGGGIIDNPNASDRSQTRSPGTVTIEKGAAIAMSAGSRVFLDSVTDITVDGSIDTPGGIIRIGGLHNSEYGDNQGTKIRIGDDARLTARGYQETLDSGDYVTRTVRDGGQILIGGSFDDSIAERQVRAVAIGAGAVIDVSGIQGISDLTPGSVTDRALSRTDSPLVATNIDGNAGAVAVNGTTGFIAGTILLGAGGETGRDGTMTVTQGSRDGSLFVRQSNAADLEPVTSVSDIPTTGLVLSVDAVHHAGELALRTFHSGTASQGIIFDGSAALTAQRSIQLDTDRVQRTIDPDGAASAVSLSAPYVEISGNVDLVTSPADPVYATDLNGSFAVHAGLIDLAGFTQFDCTFSNCDLPGNGGFGDILFQSDGDVRLVGGQSQAQFNALAAGLSSGGAIAFDAAQVYVTNGLAAPIVGAQFERDDADPGFLVRAGEQITVRANGGATPVPLNFGERLTLRAPVIDQAGVVRAPAGQIRLEASDQLTLEPGSLTSTSLGGLTVPFGFLTADLKFQGFERADWAPTQSISLNGGTVDAQAGSTVDVSGGGDLLAWTFLAGNGGTQDILAATANEVTFAILPSLGDRPAPVHPVAGGTGTAAALTDDRLAVGDVVWLGDSAGVKPGYYTLLPAYYALLDGGVLVRPTDGPSYASAPGTVMNDDGSRVTAGYRAVAGTSIRDPWSAFEILDGKTWRQYSDFTTYSFNTQKAADAALAGLAVRTLADAGGVRVTAADAVNLAGTMDFSAAKGLAGTLDIVGTQIAVTDGAAPEGYLRVDADQLGALGAGSVLIGGYRPRTSFAGLDPATFTTVGIADGVAITTVASDVLVTAGTTLALNEVVLNATDTVTIDDGAVVSAVGTAMTDPSDLLLTGDSALIRLSSGGRVGTVRANSMGATGHIRVGDGARLVTAGALSLDATADFDLARSAVFDVASLDLASDRINLGDVPEGEAGTTLGLATVLQLAGSSDLLLRGRQSIELYGDLALGQRDATGKATLTALTLDTALLEGHAIDGVGPTLTVGTLTLANSGAAGAAPASSTGLLTIDVDTLALGPGETGIGGYAGIGGKAGEIVTSGAGALNVAGDVALATGRITAANGARYAISSTGAMALTRGAAPAIAATPTLGGNLSLTGSTLMVGTDITANGGAVSLAATTGGLAILDGAQIDVSGRAVDFRDTVKYAPGGVISLASAGDLSLADGTLLNVSADARGGNAGLIEISANGRADLGGDLMAAAATGYAGGEFVLAATQTDFASLNGRLNAGNFTASRDISLDQDIVLDAGSTINAHRVSLDSTNGAVIIAGTINAGGDATDTNGGVVRLTGATVTLASTGMIDAAAAQPLAGGYDPASGSVEIAGDAVTLADGSSIDLSGGRQGGGRLMMRADRDGSGVAATLGGTVTGAREKTLVGMADYATGTVDAPEVTTAFDDANTWLAGAAAPAGWDVGAGIGFTSAGDLAVTSDIDLAAIDGAGYLGLRAAGDLLIDADISDGFAATNPDATLEAGRSFSYGFDAGGDVTIGADHLVRTGTGDIRIAAGRDLVLTTNGSVIYSAGSATPTEAGFDLTGFAPVATGDIRAIGAFPTLGGDVSLSAGRDISAPIVTQSASEWLYRYGRSTWDGNPADTTVLEQTSWSIVYGNFQSGVAAFGGGDVRVRAGRDVQDLGVALPTTGDLTTPVGDHAQLADLVVRGGGDLDLRATRDLLGGYVVLGRGHGELAAGGDVGQGKSTQVVIGSPSDPTPLTEDRGLYPIFGLMDADVRVTAGGSAAVEGAYDLTNAAQACGNFGASCDGTVAPAVGSAFRGYSERAGLDLIAVGGDANYLNDGYAGTSVSVQIRPVDLPPSQLGGPSFVASAEISPGILRLAALSGDITLTPPPLAKSGLQLASSPYGTLALLAKGDIAIGYGATQPVQLQETGTAYLRDALAPASTTGIQQIDIISSLTDDPFATVGNNYYRGYTLLHADDPEPLRITALDGSISYGKSDYIVAWNVISPKPIDIYAGQDILDAALQIEHSNASQISSVVAGRDIVQNGLSGISVLGEGLLWVEAGRNFTNTIGISSPAIFSMGNGTTSSSGTSTLFGNIALPDRGADITLLAGTAQGSDYDGFANLYLDPANLADPALPLSNPGNVGKVAKTYEKELDAFLTNLGIAGVTPENRLALFEALPAERRGVFLQDVLTSELQQTGIDYNAVDGPRYKQYTRGYDALGTLFSATTELTSRDNPLGGDILLNGGTVESRSGGSIQILAPYGRIEVGNPTATDPINALTQTGVITRRGGDIGVIANGSIALDLSRVFTLQGGDILMWTSFGDITAGAGAKTSVTNVPLSFSQDQFGEVAINAFGLSTGSGIGVLDSLDGDDPDRKKSRLDLLAFFGEVNAGDAGIRVVGDLNIAALRVVNAANIQVSGDAVGIPVAAAVNVGALTSASAATSAIVKAAVQLAERSRPEPVRDIPTILNVRFVGFGEE